MAETTGSLTLDIGNSVFNNTSGSTLTLGPAAPAFGTGVTALFQGGSTINFGAAPSLKGSGTNSQTNKGILPWAVYNNGSGTLGFATLDSTGNTTTVRALNSSTEVANSLASNVNAVLTSNPTAVGSSPSVNSINFNGASAITINTATPAAPTVYTLTDSSGAMLTNTSGTISGGALASVAYVYTENGSNLVINSQVNTAIAKAGNGTLVLANSSGAYPGFSGNTGSNAYINQGTVQLGANNALGTNGSAWLDIESGGTLDLNGYSQSVGPLVDRIQDCLRKWVSPAASSPRARGMATLIIGATNPGNQNYFRFGGSIQGANVAVQVRPYGNGTERQILAGNNTYGGPTQMLGNATGGGNILLLSDNGRLSGTSAIAINGGSYLQIDNTGLYNINGRVNSSAGLVTLNSGNIIFNGRAQTASTETLRRGHAELGRIRHHRERRAAPA